jgi:vanillate O-demethylase ferredoxin subunit
MIHTWLDVIVSQRLVLCDELVELELVSPVGDELPVFEPGAYIDIQIHGGILRPYSLCSSARERHRYRIAIRRERESRGASAYLCDVVKVGQRLRIGSPKCEFRLNRSSVYSVLLGAGVGLTPLLSMADDLWSRGAGFELHYSDKSATEAPFLNHLQKSKFKDRLKFYWSSNPKGRINFEHCLAAVPRFSDLYFCGPKSFMDSGITSACILGWSLNQIHFEIF